MRLTRTHTRWEWEGIRLDCLSVELEPGCGGEISFFIPLECFNHQSDESHMAAYGWLGTGPRKIPTKARVIRG